MTTYTDGTATDLALAERWAHDPKLALDELGQLPQSQDRALTLVKEYGQTAKFVSELNRRLEHLTRALQASSRHGNWWRRFTGAQLASHVALDDLVHDLAHTADTCDSQLKHLREMRSALSLQIIELREQTQALHVKANTARQLVADPVLGDTMRQSMGEDQWLRFARRAENTHALANAMGQTATQCELALNQTRSLEERFDDIQTFLLPIWRQRLGFDMVRKNLSQLETP